MMRPILESTNLTKRYGDFTAVKSVSFSIHSGEIVGLLGPNGAGKTTTIQMLLGLTSPSGGTISYFGQDFSGNREAALERINYVSAFSSLQTRVTVRENLETFAGLYGVPDPNAAIRRLTDMLGVAEKLDTLYWHLSSGERTRVNLVKAFLNEPKIILMDEPTASLDPEIVDVVLGLIERMRKEKNIAILYTSHNMSEVARICDEVIFLHHGSIIATDSPLGLSRRVGSATLRLTFDGDVETVRTYVTGEKYEYRILRNHIIELTISEKLIPKVLFGFAKEKIWITDIEIEKPNLEDVFLAVARKGAHALA